MCAAYCLSAFYGSINLLRELWVADFHKHRIYRSGRVWPITWGVVRRMSSRGSHGRRAAVDLVVCLFSLVAFQFLIFVFVFFQRTRLEALPHVPGLLVMRPCFAYIWLAKYFHIGVCIGFHYLNDLSSVYCARVSFVVFIVFESCK